jgi:hypothetical protein
MNGQSVPQCVGRNVMELTATGASFCLCAVWTSVAMSCFSVAVFAELFVC